jgi:hypothetical protein
MMKKPRFGTPAACYFIMDDHVLGYSGSGTSYYKGSFQHWDDWIDVSDDDEFLECVENHHALSDHNNLDNYFLGDSPDKEFCAFIYLAYTSTYCQKLIDTCFGLRLLVAMMDRVDSFDEL